MRHEIIRVVNREIPGKNENNVIAIAIIRKQKQILCIKKKYKNVFYNRVYEFGSRPKVENR